jgi:hypothetical protein
MIPMAECKDRYTYRIASRNLLFGVFRAATGGFLGLRNKFSHIYIFEEYHWEASETYGTVQPIEELEILPEEIILDTDLGSECSVCGKLCAYVRFPEGEREITLSNGHKIMIEGEWLHTEPTDCEKAMACSRVNKALEAWLYDIEKRYPDERLPDGR